MIINQLHRDRVPNGVLKSLGKKIHRLTIIEYAGYNNGKYYVKVKCECGEEKIIDISNLLWGTTKSCGCLNMENFTKILNKQLNII